MRKRKRHRVKKKKSIFKKRGFWISILFFLTSGLLVYFFAFSQTFQIKEIRISGNEKVSSEDLKDTVDTKIEKSFFLSIENNIFLANLKGIEKTILDKFPQVAEAKLKRNLPNTLVLEIRERAPLAVFCQDSKGCFKIDKEGVAFEESGEDNGLTIFSQKEEELILGKKVIREDYLKSILEIQKSLKGNLKIEIEKFLLFDDKLSVKTAQGFEIYFDLRGNVSEQIFNLDLILKEKIPPENRGELQYIDLRFGDRVFYK